MATGDEPLIVGYFLLRPLDSERSAPLRTPERSHMRDALREQGLAFVEELKQAWRVGAHRSWWEKTFRSELESVSAAEESGEGETLLDREYYWRWRGEPKIPAYLRNDVIEVTLPSPVSFS